MSELCFINCNSIFQVYIDYINNKSLHFGKNSNYEKLKGSYFEQENVLEDGFIYKSIIYKIQYEPDDIYNETDGNAGRCWSAQIIDGEDNNLVLYYFRNFYELEIYFKKKGYIFVKNDIY